MSRERNILGYFYMLGTLNAKVPKLPKTSNVLYITVLEVGNEFNNYIKAKSSIICMINPSFKVDVIILFLFMHSFSHKTAL